MFCNKCENILNIKSEEKIQYINIKTVENYVDFFNKNKNDFSFNIKTDFELKDLENYLNLKKNKNMKKIIEFYNTTNFIKKNNYIMICNNCDNKMNLEPKTIFYKISYNNLNNNNNNTIFDNVELIINNPILPKTNNYICQNSDCKTHTIFDNKKAVIYRVGDTFNTYYICCVCHYVWSAMNQN